MKHTLMAFALSTFILCFAALTASAQDSMAMSKSLNETENRPTVVLIRADWCPYCKELEPKIAKLVEQFGDQLNLVTLDITNSDTTEKSSAIAKNAGFAEYFEKNKRKASTVAIS